MPKNALDQAVTRGEDDRWDFQCPGIQGSPCGDKGVPFRSTGWPTRVTATERGREHFAEHKGEGVTSSLEEFRAKHGLGVNTDGHAVTLEEI
jgi:hypothetical protein